MSLLGCLWVWVSSYLHESRWQTVRCITEESIRVWVMTPPKVTSLGPLEGLQITQQVRASPLSSNCYLLCFFYFLILPGIPFLSRREENSYTTPDCGEAQNSLPWSWTLSLHLCSAWSTNHALPCQETRKQCMSSQQNSYVLKLASSIGK